MQILAAIPLTPEVLITGFSVLANVIQYFREKNTKKALETVVDGVEQAAVFEKNPKTQVKIQTWTPAAKAVLDTVLKKKGYKKKG
jgi:hypothetical protein